MPIPPLPPRLELPEQPRGSWLAILLMAGVTGMLVVVLTFLTIGYFGPVLIVAAAMGCIVLFHYVVWGWWLGKVLRQAAAEEEARRDLK